MARYEFRLDLTGSGGPLEEDVAAENVEEAQCLAEIRLLMSRGISRVTVSQSGAELLHIDREHPLTPIHTQH